MQIIGAEDVAATLTWNSLIERMAQAFREGVEAPPRHHHPTQRVDASAITLFKSVGASLENLVAAIEVWERSA